MTAHVIVDSTVEQYPMWARAIWFLLVGWWLGAFYLTLAWTLCVLIITLPIGLWLFNRVGAVMTMLRDEEAAGGGSTSLESVENQVQPERELDVRLSHAPSTPSWLTEPASLRDVREAGRASEPASRQPRVTARRPWSPRTGPD